MKSDIGTVVLKIGCVDILVDPKADDTRNIGPKVQTIFSDNPQYNEILKQCKANNPHCTYDGREAVIQGVGYIFDDFGHTNHSFARQLEFGFTKGRWLSGLSVHKVRLGDFNQSGNLETLYYKLSITPEK